MRTRNWLRVGAAVALALTLPACQTNKLRIRRIRDGQELPAYQVKSLTGTRDGDQLGSQLVLANHEGTLTMLMKFKIGVPTKLESGTYTWNRQDAGGPLEGSVHADAVIFQGGQDTPPSLGGTFQLVGKDVDVSLYEVRLPATPLQTPGPAPVVPK